ncbi:MAG: hypothetical protein ACKOVA_16515 [Novosphingobium sp.]
MTLQDLIYTHLRARHGDLAAQVTFAPERAGSLSVHLRRSFSIRPEASTEARVLTGSEMRDLELEVATLELFVDEVIVASKGLLSSNTLYHELTELAEAHGLTDPQAITATIDQAYPNG